MPESCPACRPLSQSAPEEIRSVIESYQRSIVRYGQMWAEVATTKGVMHEFPAIESSLSLGYKLVVVNIYPDRLADVPPLLKRFNAHGYVVKTMEDDPTWKKRTWSLEHRLLHSKLEVVAWLEKSTACRFVKVSEKKQVVTTPVYKLECDDPAEAAAAAPPKEVAHA